MSRYSNFVYPLLVMLGLLAAIACTTEEPELAATTVPTASAMPTETVSVPTQITKPTTAPTTTQRPTPTTTPWPTATPQLIAIDCDDEQFKEQILKLSEENKNQFAPRILKLYSGAEKLERSERVLRCRGEALLSRGGESYITYHYEIDRDGDAFIGYQIGDAISTPTPTTMSTPTPAPPGYSIDQPVKWNEVLVGSDETEIRLVKVVEDARRQVAEENQFNDPPEDGKRFYMIAVEVANPSSADSIEVGEFDFNLIGDHRIVYDQFDHSCGLIPDELDGEIFGGGQIRGNICFEIPEDEGGLILIHEPGYGATSRRFLTLPIPASKPTPEATAAITPTIGPPPTPTKASTPTATLEPTVTSKVGFGPGTYQVGSDIQPGIYAGKAGADVLGSCYWARLSGVSGESSDIIANDIAKGQFYVEVLDTDKYFEIGCNIAPLDAWPIPDAPLSKIGPGTYLVGRDVTPGIYRGEAGTEVRDSCYWARLSGVSGESSDIIANDIAKGVFFVDVQSSDYAFYTGCDLELSE